MLSHAHAWTLFLALAATGPVFRENHVSPSQPATPSEPSVQDPPNQVSLADLVRADVLLEAGAAEKPAGDKKPTEAPKGKVIDLVLSTGDGQAVCVAMSVGKILGGNERIILVPTTALKISFAERQPVYLLHLSRAEIVALPEFDIKKDGSEGLDAAVERARGLSAGGGGDAPRETPGQTGSSEGRTHSRSATSPPAHVLASQLLDCALNASDAEFGRVHDGVVDVGRNAVGYLLVSRSGGAAAGVAIHVVPLRACQLARGAGKNSLSVSKTKEQLMAAPEYKKPEAGLLSPDQAKSADSFFGSKPGGSEGPKNP